MLSKRGVWAKRVEAWRGSGESAAAFCRARELSYSQFAYWQRSLRDEAPSWVPVVVVAEAPLSSLAAVELELPQGVRMRLGSASIADVVALVRGLSC